MKKLLSSSVFWIVVISLLIIVFYAIPEYQKRQKRREEVIMELTERSKYPWRYFDTSDPNYMQRCNMAIYNSNLSQEEKNQECAKAWSRYYDSPDYKGR